MSRLLSLATSGRSMAPPKTTAELRKIIGRPLGACPACGSAIWSVMHDGSIACIGCDWPTATGRGAAFPVIVVIDPDGVIRARDANEEMRIGERNREIDRAAYFLDRPGPTPGSSSHPGGRIAGGGGPGGAAAGPRHRVRVIPLASRQPGGPKREETIDEWFERLPIE
jgi:hypothetical protein